MTIQQLLNRLETQAKAWNDIAPTETFAGVTLEQFRTEMDAVRAAQKGIFDARVEVQKAIKTRRMTSAAAMNVSKRVAFAIKSHPAHGEDSLLLRISGFVTESERRSGLKRNKKAGSQNEIPLMD